MKRSVLVLTTFFLVSHAFDNKLSSVYLENSQVRCYWDAFLLKVQGNNVEAQKIVDSISNGELLITSLQLYEESSLEDICNSYFISQFVCSPQSLSKIRIFESLGLKEHNTLLDEVTPDHIKKVHEFQKKILEKIDRFKVGNEDNIDYLFLKWVQDDLEDKTRFLFHEYRVTQMFGILQDLISLFTKDHVLVNLTDFEFYIDRLEKVRIQVEQTMELMEYQKQLKIVPPRFTIEKVIKLIERLMPDKVEDTILYSRIEKEMESCNLPNINEHLKKIRGIILLDVYPAFRIFKKYCTKLLSSSHMDGVWALPDGDAYYRYCLKRQTTTTLSPDEIYDLGCKVVRETQESISNLLKYLGKCVPPEEVGKSLGVILKQPKFQYENNDKGRESCLIDLRKIAQRSCTYLYPLFSISPSKELKIESVPRELQEGKPLAYYIRSSMDGKREGTFYVNLRDMNEISQCQLESLVLHEGEPGHHFQRTIQQEINLPNIRKYSSFNAYCEGWALYCERLGFEQKFYSNIYDELGYLQWELLRSARLVVDTGIHYKRWSYEQAIEYMQKTTGLAAAKVVTEVERYFIMPGQACSYKVGQLKILEIRSIMKNSLQKHFSIKKFHDLILSLGPIPLSILENFMLESKDETTEMTSSLMPIN